MIVSAVSFRLFHVNEKTYFYHLSSLFTDVKALLFAQQSLLWTLHRLKYHQACHHLSSSLHCHVIFQETCRWIYIISCWVWISYLLPGLASSNIRNPVVYGVKMRPQVGTLVHFVINLFMAAWLSQIFDTVLEENPKLYSDKYCTLLSTLSAWCSIAFTTVNGPKFI